MFDNLISHHIHRATPLPAFNTQAYSYILAGNGVFLCATNPHFYLLQPIANCQIRGLPALSPTLHYKHGKMPASLLTILHADAQQQTLSTQLHEEQYLFKFQDDRYQLIKPPQHATPASVISQHSEDAGILLDIHSHGKMPAFWSETDNQDEQGFRAYGVIGNLTKQPEIRLRLGVYGYWFPIPLSLLFEEDTGTILRDCFEDSGR